VILPQKLPPAIYYKIKNLTGPYGLIELCTGEKKYDLAIEAPINMPTIGALSLPTKARMRVLALRSSPAD